MNFKKVLIFASIIFIMIFGILGGGYLCYKSKIKQADKLMTQGDYDKAVAVYKKALNIHKDEDTQSKLAKAKDLLSKQEALKNSGKAFEDAMKAFDNKNYVYAFNRFRGLVKEDSKNYDKALKKAEECKNLHIVCMIKKAGEFASKHNYSKVTECLDSTLSMDPNNKQITDLRGKYKTEEDNHLKAKAEAKAEAKKEAEVKAMAEAETKKYQPQKIVDTSGKQIWKIYVRGNSLHFTATYKGTGNFIVKISNSNQDLVSVIANEIGDYVSDKTVYVPYEGWYYLQIEGTDGSWKYNWQ